jgi:hypothetical protein
MVYLAGSYNEAVVSGGYKDRFTVDVPPTTLRSCRLRGGMEIRKEGVHPVLPNILVAQVPPPANSAGTRLVEGKRVQFFRDVLNLLPSTSSGLLPIAFLSVGYA